MAINEKRVLPVFRMLLSVGIVVFIVFFFSRLLIAAEADNNADNINTSQKLDSQRHKEEKGRLFISHFSEPFKVMRKNWAITQDKRGLIYFGNSNGEIVEFDGVSRRSYKIAAPSHLVRSLTPAGNDILYVGGYKQLGRLIPNQRGILDYQSMIPLLDPPDRDFGHLWRIFDTPDGIIFYSYEKLFKWDNRRFTVWDIDGMGFAGIYKKKVVLFAKDKGMQILDDNKFTHPPKGRHFTTPVRGIVPGNSNDSLFILSWNEGIVSYNPSTGEIDRPYAPPKQLKETLSRLLVYNGVQLPDGRYVFGTTAKGAIITDKNLGIDRILDRKSGLQDECILSMYLDRQNGLWMGLAHGVARIEIDSPITYFDYNDGLRGIVTGLCRYQGQLYSSTEKGVYYLKAGKFNEVEYIWSQCWDLMVFKNPQVSTPSRLGTGADKLDILLVGNIGGVYQVENDKGRMIYQCTHALKLLQSRYKRNRIYVCHEYGVAVLNHEKGKWRVITEQLGGIKDSFQWIREAGPGQIRLGGRDLGLVDIAFDDNLDYLEVKKYAIHNRSHGLPLYSSFAVATYGDQLFFCTDKGLFRFNDSTSLFTPVKKPIPGIDVEGDIIKTFSEDKQGNIWFILDQDGRETVAAAFREPDGGFRLERKVFLRLPVGTVNGIHPEVDGITWIASATGLYRYDSAIKNDKPVPFDTLIRQVTAGKDDIVFGGYFHKIEKGEPHLALSQPDAMKPELPYSKNRLLFKYAAANYTLPDMTRYRYFLEGHDAGWSNWMYGTEKEYTMLWEGQYIFRVQSKDVFGNLGRETSYEFRVLPPWYRTFWAYALYLLILALGILAVDRYQRKRLIKREQEKTKMRETQLRALAAEAQARAVQAENDRKTHELDEARKLQLSMLPVELPRHPDWDIAVYMNTASEVGGDYYDFCTCPGGNLLAVVGDATGHGLKAGILVAVIKGIFSMVPPVASGDIPDFFDQCNRAIKKMNLGNLFMALVVVRLAGNKVHIVSGGLPPVFLYRIKTGQVETVTNKKPALGAFRDGNYLPIELDMEPGDVLLLLTDGLPELMDGNGEMFGYEKVRQLLGQKGNLPPQQIINALVENARQWLGTEKQDDDITFVVLKAKVKNSGETAPKPPVESQD